MAVRKEAKKTGGAKSPPKTSSSKASQSSKKKKIVIKKKVQQKRDISEHFNAPRAVPREKAARSLGSSSVKKRPKKYSSSLPSQGAYSLDASRERGADASAAAGDAGSGSLLMQAIPPTAAQARGRTMRTGPRQDRFRQDKDKLKEERPLSEKDPKEKPNSLSSAVPSKIEIMESIQVGDLSKKMNLRPSEVIGRLMRMGEMATITKAIDAETAALLATEYNCEVKVISLYDETVIEEENDKEQDRSVRPPVVTIMGHVDHGKTMLLDTIRRSNVIDTEAGAITQHIGAYQVQASHKSAKSSGKITFLDTPGHEAFSAMRARGASITDIVILVVAADDGVKQQTIEAIAHAREAKVPIIAAVNKIDLPEADVEKVKKELSQHGLSPEDWGGDTVFCAISAKQNKGIEGLLEAILLQAEVLDLKVNAKLRAKGYVLEAQIDPGKGPVATVLIEKGALHEGDPYVVGMYSGRVRALYDDHGKRISEALPAMPVEIAGIDGVPQAGDPFQAVENEKYGREVAVKRQHYQHISSSTERAQPSLNDLGTWVQTHKELNIIIKADVQGSVEAIREGLLRLSTKDVKVRVVHGAAGAISESDINLASASNALIIGFQVRAAQRASGLAERIGIDIKYYSVIYNVLSDIKQAMEGLLEPDKVEELTAKLEIRQVFKISRFGSVAGCMVLSGSTHRKHSVRVVREGVVIHTGQIRSLRRIKEDVNEVAEGYECGLALESFNDLREGDQLECFQIKEVARKL